MKPLVKPRQGGVSVVQGDEVLLGAEQAALNNAEANCANSGSCSLPATQHIQLRVIIMLVKYFKNSPLGHLKMKIFLKPLIHCLEFHRGHILNSFLTM